MKKLGLSPDAPTIFFAANSRKLGQHEPAIFEYILESIECCRIKNNPNVILRTHPGDPDLSRFVSRNGSIRVHMEEGRFDDAEHYANIVKHSNVTLCTGGTAALDTVANGNRVVYLGFDAGYEVDYWHSCLRHFEYEHNHEVLETGLIPVANSFEELDKNINSSLWGEKVSHEAEADFVNRFLTPLDGKSCERIMHLIEKMLPQDQK